MQIPHRKSLLISSSLLAVNAALVGIIALTPGQARACTTVNSDTTISGSATCVTWTGGNLTTSGTASISGSNTAIANSASTVGSLTNSGSIAGTFQGVNIGSSGVVAAITNNSGGVITAQIDGIENGNSIGTIINAGSIVSSSGNGIRNNSNATITAINNQSGGYLYGHSRAIYNSQSIGAINNAGTISSNNDAIDNSGNIDTIINNSIGKITSTGTGAVRNFSTIGTISNFGTISGQESGIVNDSGTITGITNNNDALINASSGITNNSGVIGTITNNGTIGLAQDDGINNSNGTITAITNNGVILTQYDYGIYNTGTIGTVTNNGTITSSSGQGINNSGSIIVVTNESGATINSRETGINNSNSSASIGTLTNIGTIAAGSGAGINNYGTIGTLSNSGPISAHYEGINNGGTIGTLTNSATIIATSGEGISSSNSIGTLSNSGFISGHYEGMTNFGTINILNNSGTLLGSLDEGLLNTSTIGSFTNSGLIAGPSAINSNGAILSSLSNSGTIAGNVNVAQALTITGGSAGTLGTLTGYNGTIATITTNNNDLTFDTNAYQLMDDDINVGASNTVFNNGLIRVNTTHSITGNYNQGAGGTLVIGVTDPTHYGQLIVSGAAAITGGSILIAPTSGSLSAGETLTIVQAATAGTSYTDINATANGFMATTSSIIAGGFDDLIVSLTPTPTAAPNYMQVGQQVAGANGAAVGTVLDQLQTSVANGNNTKFAPVLAALNTIGAQQGAVAEGAAIKQLAPGELSAGVTGNNFTAAQSMMVVSQHQQYLHTQNLGGVGRSSGSEYQSNALWMQVDGGFANSSTAGAAYHQSYYGITFGADDKITQNATVGLAVGWAHNSAQGANDLSGDSVSTSTPEIMGYGTYRMGQAYVNGMLGVGYNMYTQSRAIGFLNSVASSSYGGMQYMGNAETGYDFTVSPRTTMTPLIGFNAVRTDTNGYTETGAGAADTSVSRQIINSYSTLLGARMTTSVPTIWGSLLPEVKLAWEHDLNGSPISSNATLQGVNFSTSTPRTAQDGGEVSLGATLQTTDALSIRAEYDGDLRSDFQSHTGLIKGEWKF